MSWTNLTLVAWKKEKLRNLLLVRKMIKVDINENVNKARKYLNDYQRLKEQEEEQQPSGQGAREMMNEIIFEE